MRRQQLAKKHPSWLYEIVFGTLYIKTGVFVLFAFLLLQPVGHVFAADETAAPAPLASATETMPTETPDQAEAESSVTASEPVSDTAEEMTNDDTSPAATSGETAAETESAAPAANEDTALPETGTVTESGAPAVDDVTGSTTQEVIDATTTDPVADTEEAVAAGETETVVSTSTEQVNVPTTDPVAEGEDAATSTDTAAVDTPEEAAATVEPAASTSEPAVIDESLITSNDLNRYQFGTKECVSVGDGAFYCTKNSGAPVPKEEDGVYSEADAGGDAEIFMRSGSSVIQITHNDYDDLAPQYDPSSDSIVWHRLLGGRYEIMSYDLDAEKEEQLTHNSVNDMQPSRSGEYTVWQRWVDGNWEIMLSDGTSETQLSHSSEQDVAPTIRDGYVMWNTTTSAGEKLLSVYEIATKHTSTIADPDGGQVENPRFVLVYDTSFENGDVITKEYDPKTGAIVPVGSKPAPLPKLPQSSDSTGTGEAAALVGAKTSSRDDVFEHDDLPTGGGTATTTPQPVATSTQTTGAASSTQSAALDIDLSVASTSPFSLTEYDLVVPPIESAATTSTTSAS